MLKKIMLLGLMLLVLSGGVMAIYDLPYSHPAVDFGINRLNTLRVAEFCEIPFQNFLIVQDTPEARYTLHYLQYCYDYERRVDQLVDFVRYPDDVYCLIFAEDESDYTNFLTNPDKRDYCDIYKLIWEADQ